MDYNLTTIISYLLKVLEVFIEFFVVFSIFKVKPKATKFLFTIFSYTLIVFSLRIITPYSISWLIHPISLSLTFIILFKIKWFKVVPLSLLILTVVSVFDTAIVFIFVSIFKLPSSEALVENQLLYYTASILLLITLFIISLFINYLTKHKHLTYADSRKNLSLIINSLATFILILPTIYMLILYFDKQPLPLWIIFLNIFSFIFMMIISIFNTNNSIKRVQDKERETYRESYITTLENLVDSLRTFKHDYSNTLATINGYIQLENWSSLKKFFSQIMDESKAISTLDKLNPNLIKNPTIFGLITAKYQVCLKRNIKMNFEILGTLEELSINEFELSRILGIFLDNAIEAASGSKERKINFLISELKTKTTIELSNSYSSENLQVPEIFKKGVSSKGEGRGLGLFKVKQILNKYPNVRFETISNNNLFLQKLVIPKA